jgi:hypothetical protein
MYENAVSGPRFKAGLELTAIRETELAAITSGLPTIRTQSKEPILN